MENEKELIIRQQVLERVVLEKAVEETEEEKQISSSEVYQCLRAKDLGDGMLYRQYLEGDFLYVKNAQEWLIWQGHHWEDDIMDFHLAGVEKVALLYLGEASALNKAINEADGEEKGFLINQKKDLMSRVNRLRSSGGRRSCVEFSHTHDDPIAISGKELDCKPWLLACVNGVIDLRSGVLRAGQGDDYLYRASPVEWQGLDCAAPAWEKSLLEIMDGKQELVGYLQRLFGYAITGLTTEHILPVFWGQGRNGKSVVMDMIFEVMGDLATPVQSELLLDQGRSRSSSGPSPDIMTLKGRRIVVGSETDQGRRISPSRAKWLSGGDKLVGRYPHDKKETPFTPSHTLFLLTNHKPHAPADDYAFWARVHLIPFSLSFVTREPQADNERRADPDLLEKWKEEASGILAWLVQGCLAWQEEGLNPPEEVLEATAEYRRGEDYLADFLEECCLLDPLSRAGATDLYKAFEDWYQNFIGKNVPKQKRFGELMSKKFEKIKSNGANFYKGLELVEHQATMEVG